MSTALTYAQSSQRRAANGKVAVEDNPRRLRVYFNGLLIADTQRSLYLFESKHVPVYYFPLADVRTEYLSDSTASSYCPWKGTARYWDLVVGERKSDQAVWNYPVPLEDALDLSEYVSFYWDRVDAVYEEDERVFGHARDPYKRIDVLDSSRHVEVYVDDEKVADTRRPRVLFETGIAPRYYVPRLDVRGEWFRPSATITTCPYKGFARYVSYDHQGKQVEDIAWYYPHTTAEASGIDDFLSFYPEKVTRLVVDGVEI